MCAGPGVPGRECLVREVGVTVLQGQEFVLLPFFRLVLGVPSAAPLGFTAPVVAV